MKNLIGQVVNLDEKKNGQPYKRTFLVKGLETVENKTFYQVENKDTGLPSLVDKNVFDQYFLVKRETVKGLRHREKIANKSQVDYKK